MRINLFSNIQSNNYNKENNYRKRLNNQKTSFGVPQKTELKKRPLEFYIPTPQCYIDYAKKMKEDAAKEAERQIEYNKRYMEELSVKYEQTRKELEERENATSTYYAGFADHHDD